MNILILSWVLMVLADAPLSSVFENNRGVKSIQQESYTEGLSQFVEALKEAPHHPSIHLNVGVAYEYQEDAMRALKSYRWALEKAKSEEERFVAHFNIARIEAAAKNYDSAFDHYQKALDIFPASYETKVNIELLFEDRKSGGGGGGESEQKKKNQQQDQNSNFKKNPKPKPFKSKNLNERDVKKIFRELLQQEQRIRKDFERQKAKERPGGKDW